MPTPLRPSSSGNLPPNTRMDLPPSSNPTQAVPDAAQAQRKKSLVISGYVILLLIIAALGGLLYMEKEASREVEAQSEKALSQFLKNPQVVSGKSTALLIHNMRFCWSKKVCVNTDLLTANLMPLTPKDRVIFDNPNGFMVNVGRSDVMISPKTMEGMFNESIFNYPGSNLRNLRVTIKQAGVQNRIKLDGSLKYIFWIPFTMDTNMRIDKATNTLVISVQKLRVFGILPATWVLKFKPFNLDKMLTLPKNNHLTVHHNLMMVKPFGLFPPPRINGVMDKIVVGKDLIQLSFAGKDPGLRPMPVAGPKNFIYLDGGETQFGRLGMRDSQIEVIEKNPGKLFQFSLLDYASYLPASDVQLKPGNKVVVYMPNHRDLPEGRHAKADVNTPVPPVTEKPGFFKRVGNKIKSWFHHDEAKKPAAKHA